MLIFDLITVHNSLENLALASTFNPLSDRR